jgi:oxaloacetate decarboxylase alpha subunit
MAEQVKKPLKITETVLRDAHQSLIATRMTTEQMLPIVDKMDKVGYHSVECWGGATFDASLRFLKEDPWERLRKLRDGFKNTKLQMLFRGQNILGYNHYADDVVEYFVQKSIANGIDIIRIFDCFNDLRNLETAVKAAKKEKGHAQIALSYTLGDAYTLDYWKETAKRIEDMGADLYQGYGWTFASIQGYRACTGIKGWFISSYSDAYTLYIWCSFNDILKSSRSRC